MSDGSYVFSIRWAPLLLLLVLVVNDATCLAVNNDPHQKIVRVISTKNEGGLAKVFTFDDDMTQRRRTRLYGSLHGVKQVQAALRSTFLPSGYPSKTPAGYLSYSMWSWVQDLSTQLRSVLATQRVLEGVGVGREGATALSALMNFLVRDGCGMAATLLFTSVSSSRFKTDIKRWRLFADVMVDLGITLEVAATLVPQALFLPMICVGNMCKAVCGVAAGACGGAINLHWAKGSDISDINAKFGAQHTVTGSLGLIFAALFARSVSNFPQAKLWLLYSSLTLLHLYANVQCMRLIAFDSFNNDRMNMIVKEFLQAWEPVQSQEGTLAPPVEKTLKLSSPEVIAKQESLFFLTGRVKVAPLPIHFGVSFDEFCSTTGWTALRLQAALQQCRSDKYILAAGSYGSRGPPCVVVSFLHHASPEQHAKAYFHAILLSRILKERGATTSSDGKLAEDSNAEAEQSAREELDSTWNAFAQSCDESGWDLSKIELHSEGYELELQTTL